jgi:hypothetical protein
MQKDLEFSISENTFENLLKLKKQMGYENKGWDEWFTYICAPILKKSKKDEIEKVMEKLHYDQWYDIWVKNFALNLNNIWNESSARELDPTRNSKSKIGEHAAIIIARGPSIKKNKHLELLAKSSYRGAIVCCDGALINVLKAGITPDKFPEYYVVTIDAGESIKDLYNDPYVDKYGKKIKGIFATVAHPLAVERARQAGVKIHWLHALFDYGEGKKSFNQISALMVRTKNHLTGLPAIQTGGNIGTSSWFVSWQILKRSVIALIGVDHSWNENDTWELIISHGYGHPNKVDFDKNSTTFKRLFPKIYNPEFKCHCILDPIFQYYSSALKEFIRRSPPWVNTINATEGGCIFGDRITCMTLTNFLKNYGR